MNNNNNNNNKYKIAIAWMGIAIALLAAATIFTTVQAVQYSDKLSRVRETLSDICDMSYNPTTCQIGIDFLLGE